MKLIKLPGPGGFYIRANSIVVVGAPYKEGDDWTYIITYIPHGTNTTMYHYHTPHKGSALANEERATKNADDFVERLNALL